ncbi:MAG: PhoH family protein [Desulfurococcales archaeon]|nr:PhoH family protein [Desulfurococcales archaeon]
MKSLYSGLEPKSPGQERLKEALDSGKEIVGVFGPTGTGKSLFSISYGIESVLTGKYQRFILARPVIDIATGKEITMTSDPETYRSIASEYVHDVVKATSEELRELVDRGLMVLADPHFLRGRTFDNSIIVLDDAQSVPPETIVEVITRLGENSRLIIAGDPVFQRTSEPGKDGASLAREVLMGEEGAVIVDLGLKDIIRPGARRGIRLLLELNMRKRGLDEVEKSVYEAARIRAPDADIITVVNLIDPRRRWGIESEHVPDALIIVKEGHMGRLIGQGGERISQIEEDTGLRVRGIPLTLDFRELIRAIHPVSWIHKYIHDTDFAGPLLRLEVAKGNLGPLMGQRGVYIRFIDEIVKRLLGIGVYVIEVEERRRKRRR